MSRWRSSYSTWRTFKITTWHTASSLYPATFTTHSILSLNKSFNKCRGLTVIAYVRWSRQRKDSTQIAGNRKGSSNLVSGSYKSFRNYSHGRLFKTSCYQFKLIWLIFRKVFLKIKLYLKSLKWTSKDKMQRRNVSGWLLRNKKINRWKFNLTLTLYLNTLKLFKDKALEQ